MNILEMLADKRIFSVELIDDSKKLELTEQCDYYFSVEINKHELLQLISDLQEIANKMK